MHPVAVRQEHATRTELENYPIVNKGLGKPFIPPEPTVYSAPKWKCSGWLGQYLDSLAHRAEPLRVIQNVKGLPQRILRLGLVDQLVFMLKRACQVCVAV